MLRQVLIGLTLAAACIGTASSQTDQRAAIIAADPPFTPQNLVLGAPPRAVGPQVALFNGRDLNDWEGWLGYADPAKTYRNPPEAPLGRAGADEMFKVVTEDGQPALYVNGKTWGALVHKGDYRNYHLRLDYKWGPGRWPPRVNLPPNNGLLYHSYGDQGASTGTWMYAVEFEIMQGSTGMVVRVGEGTRPHTTVGHDAAVAYPQRRFMLGGRDIEVVSPAWNVQHARDAERPAGEWNTLDLYVLGDKAIHVVNGQPVMMVHGIETVDAAGKRTPLTHGRIQLQSEGAETYFRNIVLEPIDRLPTVTAR
ncbi:MAG: hypothetical protein BGN86_10720 [Caulobacterales bacterium 68-7]|nr:MAG: hypothetical protein BGN86_10720 [Caulobacterales bacterium 68-7]